MISYDKVIIKSKGAKTHAAITLVNSHLGGQYYCVPGQHPREQF
jgi:hypothetical protein